MNRQKECLPSCTIVVSSITTFKDAVPLADLERTLDALQQYVILAAQSPGGGLRDKPGKPADAYHTCYNLSGHSSAQHNPLPSTSKRQQLAHDFTSPFRRPLVEVDQREPEMILCTGETEEQAETRMREVWIRELSWDCDEKERIVYGDEGNRLVRRAFSDLYSIGVTNVYRRS